MSELENRTFTKDDQTKIREVINQSVKTMNEVDALREGMRDTIKSVADQLGIKPKALNGAIRAAYKQNLQDKKDEVSDVEELLNIAGL